MNDLTMTVTGWVATEPRHVVGPTGTRLTSFRLASTSRYFDRDKGVWADGNTEWFTVRTFRSAAITVMNSIEKGQPVVVQGRLRTHQWDADAGPRTDLVIDAMSVGHDLTKGVATFTRATADANLVGDVASGDVARGDMASGGDEDTEPIEAESEAEIGADLLLDEVVSAA
jgi:single-strand DNA-binding protein